MNLAARSSLLLSLALFGACAQGNEDVTASSSGSGGSATSASSAGGSLQPAGGSGGAMGSGGAGGKGVGGAAPQRSCTVPDDGLDALPFCPAPPTIDGFGLVEKWHYLLVSDADTQRIPSPPLIANLTDDNGDGVIDLCDTPDVVMQAQYHYGGQSHVRALVLSGKDGSVEAEIDTADAQHPAREMSPLNPAVFDLDGNGVPEILVTNRAGHVMALSPAGAILWESPVEVFDPIGEYQANAPPANRLRAWYVSGSAIAVADIDGDGSPEILVGMSVLDAHGNLRFQDPTQGAEYGMLEQYAPIRPVAADLDGDGHMEVLFGHVGYRADGTELYRLPLSTTPGLPHVADFFGDGQSEVLVQSAEGLTLISPSGQVLWGPLGPHVGGLDSHGVPTPHPAAIVDMDGDGLPEALINTDSERMIYRIDVTGPTLLVSVLNQPTYPYIAAGPGAFDFRGFGLDWLAANAWGLTLFDGMGPTALSEIMASNDSGPDFPVVADVDNDGSADVLVRRQQGLMAYLVAYEDVQRRPSPARRVWNQWNYVASGVREDAKLPAPGLVQASTFRVQSRLGCQPMVPPR